MASLLVEPGGDADFGDGLWIIESGAPVIATDIVHGSHLRSFQLRANAAADTLGTNNILIASGGRINYFWYVKTLPNATDTIGGICQASFGADVVRIRLTSAGVLQLTNSANTQLGSNGPTLATGQWYRFVFAYAITSTTVNGLKLLVFDSTNTLVGSISVTNGTLVNITPAEFYFGNASGNTIGDFRASDFYLDDSNGLTDPGNVWSTAKRTFSNGTTVGFVTQIGAGGSGYGTGHAPQVNERPNSDADGWSKVVAGSAITEEYNIEAKNVGDIDISAATIIDYMGWVRAKSLVSETAQIIVNGVTSNIALTSVINFFTKIAGSSTYPAGTGSDIGIVTATTSTTVSLYEAGINVAYIPSATILTTKTLSAVSRITALTIKTLSAVSRITSLTVHTLTAVARITALTVRTLSAISRITALTIKTLSAVSRITVTTIKTLSGISRITVTSIHTLSGIARVTALTIHTLTAVSRITATTIKTLSATARITVTTIKTLTAVARIAFLTVQTLTAKSRITALTVKTLSAVANIYNLTIQTLSATARITVTTVKTLSAVSRISLLSVRTLSAVSRVTQLTINTLSASARITIITIQVLQAVSRITVATIHTLTATSSIQNFTIRTLSAISHINPSVTVQTLSATSRILSTVSKPFPKLILVDGELALQLSGIIYKKL